MVLITAVVVVSAVDQHHTDSMLLPPACRTRSPRAWRRRDPGTGAVLAMLGVRGRIPELGHHTLWFADDWQRNFDKLGVNSRARAIVLARDAGVH